MGGLKLLPQNSNNAELITSEGIRVTWKLIDQEGTWVKPSALVKSEAVIDPIDIF